MFAISVLSVFWFLLSIVKIIFFLSGFSFTNIYASQSALRFTGDYCRERSSAHSQQPDLNRKPLISELKSLTTKLSVLTFHSGNNHFVRVRHTRFNNVCFVETLWSICKKQIYSWQIVRFFETCWIPSKSLRLIMLQKPLKQFSLIYEFKSPMIRVLS